MNVEEQRLAEWLHQVTPEPPHVIGVEDVAPQLRASHRWWVPAAVAAAVAALVVALTFGLGGTHDGTRPARPSSPTASGPSPTTRVPSPTPSVPTLTDHPWDARRFGTLAATGTQALEGRLYAEAYPPGGTAPVLYRIDPATGALLATSTQAVSGNPVAAGGLVWCVSARQDAVLGFDPATLTQEGRVGVSFARNDAVPALTTLGSGTVVLGAGNRVVLIRNDRIVHQFSVDGHIAPMGVAASADGSRLYVAVSEGQPAGRLETLDPETGAAVAPPKSVEDGGPWGLQSTIGGLWYVASGGHEDTAEFWPDGAAAPRTLDAGSSGGGIHATPTVSGNVVWLGGYGALGCGDPATGRLRARVPVADGRNAIANASISDLTVLGGKLYAVYTDIGGPATALIVMTPPADCFGR